MDINIEEKLKLLPTQAGVYLMKDCNNHIIYVGKAVNLKNRVRSYFRAQPKEALKTKALVNNIVDFEYIVTDSETEALVLECNLIKKHRPKYNINLKDGKTYPYVKITNELFPRVIITRQVMRDKAMYFGPYPSVNQLRNIVELIHQIFPLRTCGKIQFNKKESCLNFHIKRCLAPCTNNISTEDYAEMIKKIKLFFLTQDDGIERMLENEMNQHSEALEFEQASLKRDQLNAIRQIKEEQKVLLIHDDNKDFVAMARNSLGIMMQVFFIRQGKLLGRESYPLKADVNDSDEEIFSSFIKQFYLEQTSVPKQIEIDRHFKDEESLAQLLSKKHGHKVVFHVPHRGENKQLMNLVTKNALEALVKKPNAKRYEESRTIAALNELQSYLGLFQTPKRIECYDISNIQGSDSVASMVVFENGRAQKSEYRKFKIKTVEGPNDFLSMYEVISRRFNNVLKEKEEKNQKNKKFSKLPDLIIIDGGKGQLSYARKAMKETGFLEIPTFGLAKEEELLFQENISEPIVLPRNSNALYLIQRIRDETHRFAITFHRSLRGKRQLASVLDDIYGVGKKRKALLLNHFGSLSKLLGASLEEIEEVPGLPKEVAETVYYALKSHYQLQSKIKSTELNQ